MKRDPSCDVSIQYSTALAHVPRHLFFYLFTSKLGIVYSRALKTRSCSLYATPSAVYTLPGHFFYAFFMLSRCTAESRDDHITTVRDETLDVVRPAPTSMTHEIPMMTPAPRCPVTSRRQSRCNRRPVGRAGWTLTRIHTLAQSSQEGGKSTAPAAPLSPTRRPPPWHLYL